MGVDGFWPIVSSKGRRVTLDILSDKVIAVDASIWIYQFANALRDATTGEQVRASHIVGFFKRICKLLFLRIKPVFVFDGPPIPLKFAALRKRHDDTVPDSVFRKAAQQLLMQNLQAMRNGPPSSSLAVTREVPERSESEVSIDEIHVLTDSSSDEDGLSPSRRLRLTVPEEFRGFVSERRTLDSVTLPFSPFRVKERPEFEIDAAIDEEALKGLPLHEQYRGLLQTRSALLSQGRRKALNLASKLGTAGESVDLDRLSADQIKAVFDLARITDMSKSVRLQLSVEENKEEVYVPPPMEKGPRNSGFSKKRRKGSSQMFLEESFSDKHSTLCTARMVKRADLLFNSVEKIDQLKSEPLAKEESASEEEMMSEQRMKEELFGKAWDDVVPSIQRSEEPDARNLYFSPAEVQVDTAIIFDVTEPTEELVFESETDEVGQKEGDIVVEEAEKEEGDFVEDESEQGGDIVVEESEKEGVIVEETNGDNEASFSRSSSSRYNSPPQSDTDNSSEESVLVASDSEESDVQLTKDPPDFQDRVEPEQKSSSNIPTIFETIDDEDLRVFADLQDSFQPDAGEEERFESEVRERITDATDDTAVYEEIQELLTAFGIPWVSAPADAEAQCAFLCQAGLVDGVISDDSDTLIYGSPIVFRHLYMGESTVEMFKEKDLGFDRDELISLALLLGCDFTEGVRGIGPVNATEIVRHYSGLAGLSKFRDWADAGEEKSCEEEGDEFKVFKALHANYRNQWIFPADFPSPAVWAVFDQPAVSHDLEPFSWAVPDERLIVEVVCKYSNMSQEQVMGVLSPTMNQYRCAKIQRRITDYFSPAFQRGSVAEVVSKRLKAALAIIP